MTIKIGEKKVSNDKRVVVPVETLRALIEAFGESLTVKEAIGIIEIANLSFNMEEDNSELEK